MKRLPISWRIFAAFIIAAMVCITRVRGEELSPGLDRSAGAIAQQPLYDMPTEPPRVDLPKPPLAGKQRDGLMRIPPNGDLSSLQGCWETNPYRYAAGAPSGRSIYCFDANWHGRLTHVEAGVTCRAPAHIELHPDGSMYLADSNSRCDDGSAWHQDRLHCRAERDGVATCSGEGEYAPGQTRRWTTTLHRR